LNGGLNTYGYGAANPVNFIDPWGLDYLKFDGNTLTWVSEKQTSRGRRPTGETRSWPANSGGENFKSIPEGNYFTSPGDKERHPGEYDSWGPFSYRLHEGPLTRLINRLFGRTGGFHMHGGTERGTAGCIEFTDFGEAEDIHELDELIREYGDWIRVVVDYK